MPISSDRIRSLMEETLIPISEASRYWPKPICEATVRKYAKQGRRGIYLDSVWVGGRLMTSKQAIARFIEEITDKSMREVAVNG